MTIDLPARDEQLEFNRRRWSELIADRSLAGLPNKIETNAYGQILMNPPPTGDHSYRAGEIVHHLRRLLGGHALPECPISTIDGVKAADVGWYSTDRLESVRGQPAFETAAEICVEVLSASNTPREMEQKKQVYFEAGALEVWFCTTEGEMQFYAADQPKEPLQASTVCPKFPSCID
jgi:Uma2 family endonuclease